MGETCQDPREFLEAEALPDQTSAVEGVVEGELVREEKEEKKENTKEEKGEEKELAEEEESREGNEEETVGEEKVVEDDLVGEGDVAVEMDVSVEIMDQSALTPVIPIPENLPALTPVTPIPQDLPALTPVTPIPDNGDGRSSCDCEISSNLSSEEESEEHVNGRSTGPTIVHDLSSESDTQQSRVDERRERKMKKRKQRKKKLQHCCTGCDSKEAGEENALQSDLPSPLSSNNALIRCGVIQTFDEVLSTLQNSEEEIDNAISSYKDVGCRLAHEDTGQFSDVDISAPPLPRSPPGTPSSDPDALVCDFSDGVGEKLANRKTCDVSEGEEDECSGERLGREELARLSLRQLKNRITYLRGQLNATSELLVEQVVQEDSLKDEKTIVLKHIAELTQLVQGKRANDASAFRKIVVTTRETIL